MKKIVVLIIFFLLVPIVQGLEYNPIQDKVRFTLNNDVIIYDINFCLVYYNNSQMCISSIDFDDKERGISCDYGFVGYFENHIKYEVRCEIKKEQENICPMVFDFNYWPINIVTDDFERNITPLVLNQSLFALSGINKSLVFIVNDNDYIYAIDNTDSVRLFICSKNPKIGNYFYNLQIVAIDEKINKTTLHEPIILLEHPPIITLGPPQISPEIEIKNFVTGNIFEWHSELPYANLALKFEPTNKTYNKNESILVKFRGISGVEESEKVYYNKDEYAWIFPISGTKQVKFDYNSWLFPFDEYKTEINIENGSLSNTRNQDMYIPGSDFLVGLANFNQNKIEVNIFRNQTAYFMLIIILALFYIPFIYSIKKVKTKLSKFSIFQIIPFGSIFIKDLIPISSILFLILISNIIIFWVYYFYHKFKINKKNSKEISKEQ